MRISQQYSWAALAIAANSKYHRLNAEVLLERAKND